MPKDPEDAGKNAISIAENRVLAFSYPTEHLSFNEKTTLNQIYNESVLRLKRTVFLLNQLEIYFLSKPTQQKQSVINIKQLLMEENVDPDIIHALKMLKRHFYVNITNNSIGAVLEKLQPVRNNLLKTYKGLKGQLDIKIKLLQNEPNLYEINQFSGKTYTLSKEAYTDKWKISYYENNVKIKEIDPDDISPRLKSVSYQVAMNNKELILRELMLYQAKQKKSLINEVRISSLSQQIQNDHDSLVNGYVYTNDNAKTFYGSIHIDYRKLKDEPVNVLKTFLHEASHRYAWVNDRGYYHQEKAVKDGGMRPYPQEVGANTLKATNNADSYAYFVTDLTGPNKFLNDSHTNASWWGLFKKKTPYPTWVNEAKIKPLPKAEQKTSIFSSSLAKWSLFAAGATAAVIAGGAYLLCKASSPN